MFKLIFWFIGLWFRFGFFLIWNKTTWLILFLVILTAVLYIIYHRVFVYLFFKREKVGGTKTALITGGSGGIGFSLCKLFVEDEWNVIIVARNEEKMKKAAAELSRGAKSEIRTWKFDLSVPDAPEAIAARLKEENIVIDALVNNAGFGYIGKFVDGKPSAPMIMTNCSSLTNLCRLLLPDIINRNSGYIMNVASVAGMMVQPYSSEYGATKFFVRAFSFALNGELDEHSGVSCTLLSPGATKTGFGEVAMNEGIVNEKGERMTEDEIVKKMGLKLQSADDCALEGYRGMFKRVPEVVSGLDNFIIGKVVMSFLPNFIVVKMVKSMFDPLMKNSEKGKKKE